MMKLPTRGILEVLTKQFYNHKKTKIMRKQLLNSPSDQELRTVSILIPNFYPCVGTITYAAEPTAGEQARKAEDDARPKGSLYTQDINRPADKA